MLDVRLFKNKTFASANLSGFLGGMARGGLQFMLIIWLQGIWLPLHGVEFTQTPLLAAIYMLPLTLGFLIFGPISGKLSDKYGQRWFMTAGMLLNAVGFIGMSFLPVEFTLLPFAADNLHYRDRPGPLQLPQFDEHNERRPSAAEGRCRWNEGDALQYVLHVQHHNLLLPIDSRTFGIIAPCALHWAYRTGGIFRRGDEHIHTYRQPRRYSPRSWATTRSSR